MRDKNMYTKGNIKLSYSKSVEKHFSSLIIKKIIILFFTVYLHYYLVGIVWPFWHYIDTQFNNVLLLCRLSKPY